MEKEKEIKNAKTELSTLLNSLNLLQEAEATERGRKKSDFQLENLTEKGIKFFKNKYGEEHLDSVSFKRKTRKYMDKLLSTYKLNGVSEEKLETEFLQPLFKKYTNTLQKYRDITVY